MRPWGCGGTRGSVCVTTGLFVAAVWIHLAGYVVGCEYWDGCRCGDGGRVLLLG